ncbi:hypothetical protein SEVIR_3G417240v4 [Setaria viridis]|uniref:Bifunctional inhibitor/plant lipid transfer protein/seed storage helical domain-containing protein n=1 Tax=Setaria viridis TaxID=4556 RepID=A0A4V6DAJ7_SETVI|nr:inverted formin-2-like [Setaria viridis]XP_034588713.1 inverted formin-2-like [Setaria viridis]TKW29766.1 hypothetical protein SEVIR_3G417240v2 [Setaria viridis]TKW29767.1 hypothetical protein SEVIR_3G417260v2 [Setaria viridis]
MASPKLVALFLAFAVAAAALQPSEAARVQAQQGFKPAVASQEAEKVATQADGGVPSAPTLPGLPAGQLPPGLLPAILGLLFPPLGGIISMIQPLLPPPGSPSQQGGVLGGILPGTSPSPPAPAECMTPLSAMMPCTDYLTNMTVLTPPGQCCDGLKTIIRDAPICLCHGMTGGLNQFLPKPVDHLRMTALPLACGTVLPIQTLFMCNSNQVPPIMPPTPAEPLMTPATP